MPYNPKPLPSWYEGPPMGDALEQFIPMDFQSAYPKKVKQMPEETEARTSGFGFGQALANVFVLRSEQAGYSKLVTLARQFAKWAGYRSLDEGTDFMDGFIDGMYQSQPKQITEAKKGE